MPRITWAELWTVLHMQFDVLRCHFPESDETSEGWLWSRPPDYLCVVDPHPDDEIVPFHEFDRIRRNLGLDPDRVSDRKFNRAMRRTLQ